MKHWNPELPTLDISSLRLFVQRQLAFISFAELAPSSAFSVHLGTLRQWMSTKAMRPLRMLRRLPSAAKRVFSGCHKFQVDRVNTSSIAANKVIELLRVFTDALGNWFNEPSVEKSVDGRLDVANGSIGVAAGIQCSGPFPTACDFIDGDLGKDSPQVLCVQPFDGQITGHCRGASMWASMMRLTSSAMEMPSRLASRLRNALCGSVNEIICLVIYFFVAFDRVVSMVSASPRNESLMLASWSKYDPSSSQYSSSDASASFNENWISNDVSFSMGCLLDAISGNQTTTASGSDPASSVIAKPRLASSSTSSSASAAPLTAADSSKATVSSIAGNDQPSRSTDPCVRLDIMASSLLSDVMIPQGIQLVEVN